MGKVYSQDLRNRVIDAVCVENLSCRGAARRFDVSESSAISWVSQYRQSGTRDPVGTGGHRPSKLKPHRGWLLEALETKPDITLVALAEDFWNEKCVKATAGMLSYFLSAKASALKKSVLPSEQNRFDVAHRRKNWKKYQKKIDPHRLVFIDET